MRRTGAISQPIVMRWRCTSILQREDGPWVIQLRPLYPRRYPITALPMGKPRPITLPAAFEFATLAPATWKVGKQYEMRIERR
jgi:hypothetical protein